MIVSSGGPTGRSSPGYVVPQLQQSYARIPDVLEMPHLVAMQLDSFRWFLKEALRELFDELSPIRDFTGSRMELYFASEKKLDPLRDSVQDMVGQVPINDIVDASGRIIASRDQNITHEIAQALKEARIGAIPVHPYHFEKPKYSVAECRQRDMTYSAPLRVNVSLVVKETGEIKEQELFFGDFPLMTPNGTFVINGTERVVVSQLVRSPGVYFTLERDATSGRDLCYGKLIPNRGAWLEFETSNRDVVSVKVDRKRKLSITTLLRAIDAEDGLGDKALGTNDRLLALFGDADDDPEHSYLRATIEREPCQNKEEALLEFYRRMRPGDPPTLDNARALLVSLFFNPRRYDLGQVGRYKVNKRLGLSRPPSERVLTREDFIAVMKQIILLNSGHGRPDDIDHLGNRRVRAVGELIQNQFRIGLLRMERVVRERMTIVDPDQATPSALINIRPVVAAIREFFGASQLSQFMDQTNPLAELTHKRRVSALGPGGLSRERAGFEVRDVHHSHYGRICPIETPEGPNIGLIGSLATYGHVNRFGFIETPYRRVLREISNDSPYLVGRSLTRDALDNKGKVIAPAGTQVDDALAQRLAALPPTSLSVQPFASNEIVYLDAEEEERYIIAQANSAVDGHNNLTEERVECRSGQSFRMEPPSRVDFMDVTPKQIVSVATSLIPFLEHDDANRALMGSNMQRQAVPVLRPEVPLVGTGMERRVAQDSGQAIYAEEDGVVISVTARQVVMHYDSGREVAYDLIKYIRSNQGTCINQQPIVDKGQRVVKGMPLADSSSTNQGALALGQSLLCAFMSWEGYNFEDAIIISETVPCGDKFTSIHIERYEVEARDTKLGPEEITRDIPNVGEDALRNLDEFGIIRIGAEVLAGDILVGKITPKGETELTAEEKLLRAIFGEKAREVKDTSLRVPHGERGKVIDVQVFRRADHSELAAGVNQVVRVRVAQLRKVSEGDKMAGRHGNKGVVARILPVEDMPSLEDGTPVEIILNPIGVPSRMNVGQVLETHLGWAAHVLGFRAVTPVFDGANDKTIEDALARAWIAVRAGAITPEPRRDGAAEAYGESFDLDQATAWLREQGYDPSPVFDRRQLWAAKRACLELWLEQLGYEGPRGLPMEALEARVQQAFVETNIAPPVFGKQTLYDGRTGQPFAQPVTVGYMYMMKLVHLVEDKIHARSTGPYSLITQQPLGGKAQFGGQRFGEMEVWALEAYGAAHILQELLTVKSDDVVGRVKTYEAIVKGEDLMEPGVPESFKVLVKELQSLALSVEVLNEEEERVALPEESTTEIPELGINLAGFEREDYIGV